MQKQDIDLEGTARIALDDVLNGGPPKDGIPSIDNPQFDSAETTPFEADETVIGGGVNGEAKAYPYGIMNWHEIVNDAIGGEPITVTYCPLCDTIVAFERGDTTFGVSGKLYQSCLVMFDRQDDTLYAQPWGLGVVSPGVNETLNRVPAVKTTLGVWIEEHPDSHILSVETGHQWDYFEYPYGTYAMDERLVFPARNQGQLDRHPKAIVSYVWESEDGTPRNQFSGSRVMVGHEELSAAGEQMVGLGDRPIRAYWDDALTTGRFEELDSTPLPSSTAFAFVYPAFFGDAP